MPAGQAPHERHDRDKGNFASQEIPEEPHEACGLAGLDGARLFGLEIGGGVAAGRASGAAVSGGSNKAVGRGPRPGEPAPARQEASARKARSRTRTVSPGFKFCRPIRYTLCLDGGDLGNRTTLPIRSAARRSG